MVTDDDVKRIASLAHLNLTADELGKLRAELNTILSYADNLKTLDVSQVQPMSHVHGATNVMREDAVNEHLDINASLSNSPTHTGRFFRVPLIVDHEGQE